MLDSDEPAGVYGERSGRSGQRRRTRSGAASTVVVVSVVDNEDAARLGLPCLLSRCSACAVSRALHALLPRAAADRFPSLTEATFSDQHVERVGAAHDQWRRVAGPDPGRGRGARRCWRRRRLFRFTENDIDGDVEGYIDGPVRIVRRTNAATLPPARWQRFPAFAASNISIRQHSEVPVGRRSCFNRQGVVAADCGLPWQSLPTGIRQRQRRCHRTRRQRVQQQPSAAGRRLVLARSGRRACIGRERLPDFAR